MEASLFLTGSSGGVALGTGPPAFRSLRQVLCACQPLPAELSVPRGSPAATPVPVFPRGGDHSAFASGFLVLIPHRMTRWPSGGCQAVWFDGRASSEA
ncbi:hypothetical protein AAFF_G00206570 [Aldrovandia affinis]|uniref:Uncharacterized protein n=1 Tax=Aldrovandia affinis TaxID=143900 RepID=A0AAD7W5M0_9TELE|nr:hypothetical protein AAFF_G00206570 [Aldrovandia affinis]